MPATMTWVVEQMDCVPLEGTYTDVVQTVHWRCNGVEDSGGTNYYGTVYGSCTLAAPAEGQDFTPYPDLTQDQVLQWCFDATNGVNKDATEAMVQSQIDSAINPPIVTPPLPWVS